jgi:hypothetical protein
MNQERNRSVERLEPECVCAFGSKAASIDEGDCLGHATLEQKGKGPYRGPIVPPQ